MMEFVERHFRFGDPLLWNADPPTVRPDLIVSTSEIKRGYCKSTQQELGLSQTPFA